MGLLIIDTSSSIGRIIYATTVNEHLYYENVDAKTHLEWVHYTLEKILHNINKSEIEAIVVTIGPGSYTGVRIGLAAAKGLAYTLQKPIISIKTFDLYYNMHNKKIDIDYICPMIDARRMEVFTMVFDTGGQILKQETALILKKDVINFLISEKIVLFCGEGAIKIYQLDIDNSKLLVDTRLYSIYDLIEISFIKLNMKTFTDVAYVDVDYCKTFNEQAKENWKEHEQQSN